MSVPVADCAVEYAMEAISHAGTVLAVASKEGIALAAEKVGHSHHTGNKSMLRH